MDELDVVVCSVCWGVWLVVKVIYSSFCVSYDSFYNLSYG